LIAHRIRILRHNNWNRRSCFLSGTRCLEATRNDYVYLQTNKFRRKLRNALILLLGKSVLGGDILSLDPPKLLHLLPERLPKNRTAGSSAIIQETYAEDFPRLLRLGHRPAHRERQDDYKKPHPFSILDPSTRLRTGFGFSIIGLRGEESPTKYALHLFGSLNRKSAQPEADQSFG
jgi:hypothetical protein